MADTTLTIDDVVKKRLRGYRPDSHDSWGQTLTQMMELLPTVEDFQGGCINCGERSINPYEQDEYSGVVQFHATEYEGDIITGTSYFCSPECAKESQDEIESQFPTHPDAVIVGGRSELRTVVESATFYIDGTRREVGISVPGAFEGDGYDYINEPVYIENDDRIVQEGVIKEIVHEDAHTTFVLGHDAEVTRLNHPDEEVREEYEEHHAEWTDGECDFCGFTFSYMIEDPPDECPDCGSEDW